MSVEIWKGVCSGLKQETYDTEIEAFRDRGLVAITQAGDEYSSDMVWMHESEAIDIALCILKELVPGFMQNESDLVKELSRYKAAYGNLENVVRLLPKEE